MELHKLHHLRSFIRGGHNCQSGVWTKQASGGVSIAANIGLDPSIWPDHVKCVSGTNLEVLTLSFQNSALVLPIYSGTSFNDLSYHYVQFVKSTGAWQATNSPFCTGNSIQWLKANGFAF